MIKRLTEPKDRKILANDIALERLKKRYDEITVLSKQIWYSVDRGVDAFPSAEAYGYALSEKQALKAVINALHYRIKIYEKAVAQEQKRNNN